MNSNFFRALNPCVKKSGVVFSGPISKSHISIQKHRNSSNHDQLNLLSTLPAKNPSVPPNHSRTNIEISDILFSDNLKHYYNQDLKFLSGIHATFEILLGKHYVKNVKNVDKPQDGAKGALDFLIFPLLARKLILDTQLKKRRGVSIANTLAWTIALPLEVVRFSTALALTLLLIPVVALVHIIKACLPKKEVVDDFIPDELQQCFQHKN